MVVSKQQYVVTDNSTQNKELKLDELIERVWCAAHAAGFAEGQKEGFTDGCNNGVDEGRKKGLAEGLG